MVSLLHYLLPTIPPTPTPPIRRSFERAGIISFFLPFQICYGTQWNVVRQGCTSCIKINFIDGHVLFSGIHSSFDLLKLTKIFHGFVNISNGI